MFHWTNVNHGKTMLNRCIRAGTPILIKPIAEKLFRFLLSELSNILCMATSTFCTEGGDTLRVEHLHVTFMVY